MIRISCRLASLFLLTALSALALDWPVKHRVLKVAPLQRTAETTFHFTNSSDRPVTIVGIDTSCDCLEVTPSTKIVAPGAKGHLTAQFNFGDRTGLINRLIVIRTDEDIPSTQLTVDVDIPEIATLTPRSVEWSLNQAPAEQTVELRVTEELELTVSVVQSTSENFTTRLETVTPGRLYRLHLAPKLTNEVSNAAFRIYTKGPDGQNIVLSAYGNVR